MKRIGCVPLGQIPPAVLLSDEAGADNAGAAFTSKSMNNFAMHFT